MTMFDANRRSFLKGAALGGSGLLLGSVFPKRLLAQAAGLEKENRALREELERKELEHRRLIAEIHRSYKRELVLMPRSELARSGKKVRK